MHSHGSQVSLSIWKQSAHSTLARSSNLEAKKTWPCVFLTPAANTTAAPVKLEPPKKTSSTMPLGRTYIFAFEYQTTTPFFCSHLWISRCQFHARLDVAHQRLIFCGELLCLLSLAKRSPKSSNFCQNCQSLQKKYSSLFWHLNGCSNWFPVKWPELGRDHLVSYCLPVANLGAADRAQGTNRTPEAWRQILTWNGWHIFGS